MQTGSTGDTRKNRVIIEIAKKTKGGKVEELPFKPLILAKLSGNRPDDAIRDRQRVQINDRNFDAKMQEIDVRLDDLVVPSHLPGADDLAINLKFDSMGKFRPDEIVQQVPELKRLVELRGMLNAFMAKLGVNKRLSNEFNRILSSTDDYKKLLEDLKKLTAAKTEEAS